MSVNKWAVPLCAAVCAALSSHASAHVSYNGRDFLLDGIQSGTGTYTLNNLSVASNFGWSDGLDADWGDSHLVKFTKFTLTQETQVDITVKRANDVPTSTGTALNDFIPGFTLYSGLAVPGAHDGGDHPDFYAFHDGYLPSVRFFDGVHAGRKEGAFNAHGDFVMSNKKEEAELNGIPWGASRLTYKALNFDGVSVDVNGDRTGDYYGDGAQDGVVTTRYTLGPGVYSLVIGGACYACQYTESASIFEANRGFSASLTLAPVPEPESYAMLLAGLGVIGFVGQKRRK